MRQEMYSKSPASGYSINSRPFRIQPTELSTLRGNHNKLRLLLESVIQNDLLNEFALNENTYVELRNGQFVTLYFFIALRAQALLFNVANNEALLFPDDTMYGVKIQGLNRRNVINFSSELEKKIITAIGVAFYRITGLNEFDHTAYLEQKNYLDELLILLNKYIVEYKNLIIPTSNGPSALPKPAKGVHAPLALSYRGGKSGSKKKKTTKKSRKQKKTKRSKSSKKK
jgi:hypothetical protein